MTCKLVLLGNIIVLIFHYCAQTFIHVNMPTHGQKKKTLTRVGVKLVTFGLDHHYSTNKARWEQAKGIKDVISGK